MGYLRGISGGLFKTDGEGRRLFFPFGIFGKARLLRDEAEEAYQREAYENWIVAGIGLGAPLMGGVALIESSAGRSAYLLCIVIALYASLLYRVRKLPKVYDARYSIIEGWRNSARDHSYASLIFGVLTSLGLVALGCWVFVMPNAEAPWIGAGCAISAALAAALWCAKIWFKVHNSSQA